ncbi:MAG TPA: hypothetical protein P5138_11475, partial [Solirubrobacterales bacterium]|nr:hypothetical protein [Solirubrobacterales bacterium]
MNAISAVTVVVPAPPSVPQTATSGGPAGSVFRAGAVCGSVSEGGLPGLSGAVAVSGSAVITKLISMPA